MQTGEFYIKQKIYVAGPNSVSAIFYKGAYYLATSSGQLPNAMHQGFVQIRRYALILHVLSNYFQMLNQKYCAFFRLSTNFMMLH